MIIPDTVQAVHAASPWTTGAAVIQAASAVAQVITAIFIVCLTRRLASSTDSYAEKTKELVDITKTYAALTKLALDLNTRQYEDDIAPMWHLSLQAAPDSGPALWWKLVNMSKMPARVTHLLLRAVDQDKDFEKEVIDIPMLGHGNHQSDIHSRVVRLLQSYLVDNAWDGVVELAITYSGYDAAQKPSHTFAFKISVRDGRIVGVWSKVPGIVLPAEPQTDND